MRRLLDNFSRILVLTVLGIGILIALAIIAALVIVAWAAITHAGART
ncbi:MAG: hypothetical protein KGO05_07440 [Chloroflexota bacterium]|nr:hypothetical protein [Chloroflexota bacterium]